MDNHHHNFPKGKRLYIIMKDGTRIVDKYIKVDKAFLYLENYTLRYAKIRSTSINNWDGNKKRDVISQK